ncbi:MAG: hypothetical protein AB7N76_19225 [Planctomycetota bacterium]
MTVEGSPLSRRRAAHRLARSSGGVRMWFAMLALGVGCFAALWGFVWACEKV